MKKKRKKKRSNGHVTVARGMGGEGSVANGHMTVGRWGKGGRGRGSPAGAGERRKRRVGGGWAQQRGGEGWVSFFEFRTLFSTFKIVNLSRTYDISLCHLLVLMISVILLVRPHSNSLQEKW